MTRSQTTWLFLIACGVFVFSSCEQEKPKTDPPLAGLAEITPGPALDDPKVTVPPRILRNAGAPDSVHAFLVSPRVSSKPGIDAIFIENGVGYPITEGPVRLLPPAMDALSNIISDAQTYWPHEDYLCMFSPGVGFRTFTNSEPVDISVCFSCGQWVFHADSLNGGGNFGGGADALGRVVMSAFPDDAALEAAVLKLTAGVRDERRRYRLSLDLYNRP